MELHDPVVVGCLGGGAVFLLLAAYYMKSDYLRENFLKIREEQISWDNDQNDSARKKRITKELELIGNPTTYDNLNQQGLVITLALSAAILFSGLPLFLALFTLGIWYKFPDVRISMLRRKRMDAIQNQLSMAIDRITQILNIGGQLSQGFEEVAEDCPEPISGEFKKICLDLNTGASMRSALDNFYKRCPLSDVRTLCVGASIAEKVSKDIAMATLETTSEIIYRRSQQESEVEALLQKGKVLVYVLGAAPTAIFIVMTFVMHQAMMAFLSNPLAPIALGVAIVLNVVGFVLGMRIVDPKNVVDY